MTGLDRIVRRVESGFAAWGHAIATHRWRCVVVSILLAAPLIAGLPRLTIEASPENFVPRDDPARIAYEEFRAEFESDQVVALLIGTEQVFALPFLENLRRLHRDVERLPFVDEVDSLVDAPVTRSEDDTLIVEKLFERWPATDAALDPIRARAEASRVFENVYFSADRRFALMTVHVSSAATPPASSESIATPSGPLIMLAHERGVFLDRLRALVARHQAAEFRIDVLGGVAVGEELVSGIRADMALFTALSLVLAGVLLFALFRRVAAVGLGLTAILLPLAAAFGALGWAGIPLYPTLQILPSFVIAVGICDSVHLLTYFYARIEAGDDRRRAVAYALEHSSIGVMMTCCTTAGGLLSFCISDLEAIRALGWIAPASIVLALAYTLVLLPALLAIVPAAARGAVARAKSGRELDVLGTIGRVCIRHPWRVVAVWSILIGACTIAAFRAQFSEYHLRWLAPDNAVRMAAERANHEMGSALALELIVDTGRDGGISEPKVLRGIDSLATAAAGGEFGPPRVGKVLSIADVVKEIHQTLHDGDERAYVVPDTREEIAQELFLFESSGPDELRRFVDPTLRKARITLLMPILDAFEYRGLTDRIRAAFDERLGGDATLTATGIVMLMLRTAESLLSNMLQSYGLAIAVITPLMMLVVRSVRLGLLAMIPNVAPVVFGVALMHWTGIHLDMFTILIGSVIEGVAVDDTIHFMHTFRRNFAKSGAVESAVNETLATSGRAMLASSAVLMIGFGVFMFATMLNMQSFGFVAVCTLAVAALMDLTLSPALVRLAVRDATEPEVLERTQVSHVGSLIVPRGRMGDMSYDEQFADAAPSEPSTYRYPFTPYPNGWFHVARSEEVAAGAIRSLQFFGRDLIAFRGSDGTAHVTDAHCPHLGAHLGVGGKVVGNTVSCPFHGWRFDGSGECVEIPYCARIPPRARIRSWPVCERNGQILVYFDAEEHAPAFEVPVLPDYEEAGWSKLLHLRWKIRVHIQEVAENALDLPHFEKVHAYGSIPRLERFEIAGDTFTIDLDSTRAGMQFVGRTKMRITYHGLGVVVSRIRTRLVELYVILTTTPIDQEHVDLRIAVKFRRTRNPLRNFVMRRALTREIAADFSSDIPLWESKKYFTKPVLCRGDGPIMQIRRWASRFYSDGGGAVAAEHPARRNAAGAWPAQVA